MSANCSCGETDCPLGGSDVQRADSEVPPAYVVDVAGHVIDVLTLTPEQEEAGRQFLADAAAMAMQARSCSRSSFGWERMDALPPLPHGNAWCPDPRCPAHADGPHVHPMPNVGPHGEDWAASYVPAPCVNSYGFTRTGAGVVEEAPPSARGPFWTFSSPSRDMSARRPTEPLPVVSTRPAVVSTDLVVLGPDAERKVGAALASLDDEADEVAHPFTAAIIRATVDELRALLGLPRKT